MKKMMYVGAVLLTAMGAVGSVSAQNTMNKGIMKTGMKMKTGAKMNADSKFMMMLATGGMNEIGLSRTALSKSTNDNIKQFAQKMIDDHTEAGNELKSLADSKNVALPMTMDAKHMEINTKLAAMSGNSLDMDYIKAMVKDHEKTVAMLQKEVGNGKDADAKMLASKLLPTVQGHLDMARGLMTKMSGKSMRGNSTTGM